MKPSTLIFGLIPVALAAPVANADANAVAEEKRDGYASYGTYTNPAPPPKGYGTYTAYPSPSPSPPPTTYASYGKYPPPTGGYGSYGSYKRTLGVLVKKIFG